MMETKIWIELVLFVLIVLYGLYKYFCGKFNLFRKQGIPGPKPNPVFGTWLNSWKQNTHEIALENYEKFGHIYCSFHGRTPVLHIQERKLVHSILIKDSIEHFGRRTRRPVAGKDDNINKTLSMLHGEQAKVLRNLLIASISPQIIKRRFDFANDSILEFFDYLNAHKLVDGKIDLRVESETLLEEIIMNYAIGENLGTIGNPNHPFTINARKTMEAGEGSFLWTLTQLYPKLFQWLCPVLETGNDYFVQLVKHILQKRANSRQLNETNVNEQPDLVDKFLDCLNGSDQKGAQHIDLGVVVSQITSIILTGYDLGTVVTRVLHCLTVNQSEQEKCREEIREALVKNNGELSFSILPELAYMDQCIREALRLYPTIYMLCRTCTKDKQYEEIFIPKGTAIEIPIYIMQRDPAIYVEPDKFIPERFSLTESVKLDPLTFLTFGQGPRSCFAQKFAMILLKHCLAQLLTSYEFFPVPETKNSLSLTTGPNGIMTARDVWVGIKKTA